MQLPLRLLAEVDEVRCVRHHLVRVDQGNLFAPGLVAKVLEIQKDERIVLQWINAAWTLALTESETSDVPSIVSLEFTDTTVGADIILTQIGVPTYQIAMTSSPFNPHGEVGPLSEIIRVHWELAYWQPIRRYLASRSLEK